MIWGTVGIKPKLGLQRRDLPAQTDYDRNRDQYDACFARRVRTKLRI